MGLNNLQLTSHLLTKLYHNTLVETKNASAVPEKPLLKHLGNNKKSIAIIISNPNNPFLPDDELTFLTNILLACKLDLADIALINSNGAEAEAVEEKLDDLKAKTVLLIGVSPSSINLPINFPHFQVQKFAGRTYLFAPELTELQENKALKMNLWNSLKTIFGL